MKDRSANAKFAVVIYDGVEPIDIGGTVGVLSMATRILPGLETTIVAETSGPVRLAGGLTVIAEHAFAQAPVCDVAIVCGGPGWREQVVNPAMLSYLRTRDPHRLASVCTGALILAAAGLLDGRMATTRRAAVGSETDTPVALLSRYGKNTNAVPAVVVDADVVTGGGVSLAIDTTLYLLGRFYGEDARDDVARIIEYDRAYAANQAALPLIRAT
jgi:transcriptional regulator GlxA family with amidase domain